MASSGKRVGLDDIDIQSQDERLTTKHVRTLAYTQSLVDENERLRRRVSDLEVIVHVDVILCFSHTFVSRQTL